MKALINFVFREALQDFGKGRAVLTQGHKAAVRKVATPNINLMDLKSFDWDDPNSPTFPRSLSEFDVARSCVLIKPGDDTGTEFVALELHVDALPGGPDNRVKFRIFREQGQLAQDQGRRTFDEQILMVEVGSNPNNQVTCWFSTTVESAEATYAAAYKVYVRLNLAS